MLTYLKDAIVGANAAGAIRAILNYFLLREIGSAKLLEPTK